MRKMIVPLMISFYKLTYYCEFTTDTVTMFISTTVYMLLGSLNLGDLRQSLQAYSDHNKSVQTTENFGQ